MPVSAISSVEKIGYELVRTDKLPKDGGKPATMEDYAKLDFEPWEDKGREGSISNEQLCSCGVDARIAERIMVKSKSDDDHGRRAASRNSQ